MGLLCLFEKEKEMVFHIVGVEKTMIIVGYSGRMERILSLRDCDATCERGVIYIL